MRQTLVVKLHTERKSKNGKLCVYPAIRSRKQAEVAILISEKVDFKPKLEEIKKGTTCLWGENSKMMI